MLEIASAGEYVCGIKTERGISTFHDTSSLYRFVIHTYVRISDRTQGAKKGISKFNPFGYSHLRDFHKRALNWTFPNENVTEVCYGGTFALPAYRIMELAKDPAVRNVVMNLEEILLTRNVTSSVEEHFIERLWAGILANPLGKRNTDIILDMKQDILFRQGNVAGAVMGVWNKT
jgi:hypothetical protein